MLRREEVTHPGFRLPAWFTNAMLDRIPDKN